MVAAVAEAVVVVVMLSLTYKPLKVITLIVSTARKLDFYKTETKEIGMHIASLS